MNTIGNNSSRILSSGLLVLLFWIIIGSIIHVWVPHGQDAGYNIVHVQNGPLLARLVHFSYIFVGYAIYHLSHWFGITALQSLGIVSVMSFAIGGWAVFKIGYHLNGRILGWAFSLLVWPLPFLVLQAQGQEYQPFATSMMVLSWYFWIVHRSLVLTSFTWAVSVLANPANALLFATFTGFLLLKDLPIKKAILKSVTLWCFAALPVIAFWAPTYKNLLYAQDGWAVAPILSKTSYFSTTRLFKCSAFFLYSVLANYFIVIFGIPLIRIKQRLQSRVQGKAEKDTFIKVLFLSLTIIAVIFPIFIAMGHARSGRYYTPLLHWLTLFSFLRIYHLMDAHGIQKILNRWLSIGILQLLIVVFLFALPYKYKAYQRYHDYHMIIEKYPHLSTASMGAMNIGLANRVEKRLDLVNFDKEVQVDALKSMLRSEKIDSFILVYNIDSFDKALLKRLLSPKLLRICKAAPHRAEDMLRNKGFKVNLKPLPGAKSGNIYMVKGQ